MKNVVALRTWRILVLFTWKLERNVMARFCYLWRHWAVASYLVARANSCTTHNLEAGTGMLWHLFIFCGVIGPWYHMWWHLQILRNLETGKPQQNVVVCFCYLWHHILRHGIKHLIVNYDTTFVAFQIIWLLPLVVRQLWRRITPKLWHVIVNCGPACGVTWSLYH